MLSYVLRKNGVIYLGMAKNTHIIITGQSVSNGKISSGLAFAVENPGYLAASRGLRGQGVAVAGIELDAEGLRLDRLQRCYR